MKWLNGGIKGGYNTVLLQAGYYRVAIAHREKTETPPRRPIQVPSRGWPEARTRIHPVDPEQDGLWVQYSPSISIPQER